MAKEYLVVSFPQTRRVMINGTFMGNTNQKLELEGGLYEVTLDPPQGAVPGKQTVDLRNTASLMPKTIEFTEGV